MTDITNKKITYGPRFTNPLFILVTLFCIPFGVYFISLGLELDSIFRLCVGLLILLSFCLVAYKIKYGEKVYIEFTDTQLLGPADSLTGWKQESILYANITELYIGWSGRKLALKVNSPNVAISISPLFLGYLDFEDICQELRKRLPHLDSTKLDFDNNIYYQRIKMFMYEK